MKYFQRFRFYRGLTLQWAFTHVRCRASAVEQFAIRTLPFKHSNPFGSQLCLRASGKWLWGVDCLSIQTWRLERLGFGKPDIATGLLAERQPALWTSNLSALSHQQTLQQRKTAHENKNNPRSAAARSIGTAAAKECGVFTWGITGHNAR